jgi:mono/diheme cytochrome c family protein
MVLKLVAFLLVSILYACSSEPVKSNPIPPETPAQKSANLFILYCASCHGEDGKLGSSGAKDLSKSILSIAEINEILANGKNAMPPMNELLGTKENQELVVNHVLSLRK